MPTSLASTGETQVISTEEHHGFVDNCIALIESLLESRAIPDITKTPADPSLE
jgi:hypothetical protein